MKREEQLAICRLVAQAIVADGQLRDEERAFVDALMDRYGLTPEERKEVLSQDVDADPGTIAAQVTEFLSRNQLVLEVVMAVAADGELSKAERALLHRVGEAVGISADDMDMLVHNALA